MCCRGWKLTRVLAYYTKLTSILSFSRFPLAIVVAFHWLVSIYLRTKAFLSKLIIRHRKERRKPFNKNKCDRIVAKFISFCISKFYVCRLLLSLSRWLPDIYFARKETFELCEEVNKFKIKIDFTEADEDFLIA